MAWWSEVGGCLYSKNKKCEHIECLGKCVSAWCWPNSDNVLSQLFAFEVIVQKLCLCEFKCVCVWTLVNQKCICMWVCPRPHLEALVQNIQKKLVCNWLNPVKTRILSSIFVRNRVFMVTGTLLIWAISYTFSLYI